MNPRDLPCNSPRRDVQGGKRSVVRACANGKSKVIRFGDASMTIGKDNAARKKSYCARSGGIKGKDNKLTANFWARKSWRC